MLAVEQNSGQPPGTGERNNRVMAVPFNAPKYNALKEVRDVESLVRLVNCES